MFSTIVDEVFPPKKGFFVEKGFLMEPFVSSRTLNAKISKYFWAGKYL